MKNKILILVAAILSMANSTLSTAQIFTKVTSITNPIVTDPIQTFYAGASWVDYDNDGWIDLFVVRGGLYHNNGNASFSKIVNSGLGLSTGIGNSWSDVDNDGDIDCFLSGGNAGGSKMFMNNGNGTFNKNVSGPFAIDTLLRGWGSSFGDYNNDGLVDLFIASPVGFASIIDSCKFLVNTGGGNFVRVDSTVITDTLDAFTVPSWSDYDNDGDLDLFIGAGRVNGSLSLDYLFDNNHAQGSGSLFTRINSTPLGTDFHDGQIWNWIDFDNDGDLDAYLTNYAGSSPASGYQNEMYRNDNNSFVKLKANDVGPIVSDLGVSLSSTWGDFDNDGDLDCIVTNESLQKNVYYQNNVMQGSTVFTKITNEPFVLNNGNHFCAASCDYDNDGDLDLFISGASDKGLFENTTTQTDFINIKLIGISSNSSAIGAKVRVKAKGLWQMREISAQNTFNGMNMLNAHFGFGNTGPLALYIDSLIIEWPSGNKDICTNVSVNTFYTAIEGQCLTPSALHENETGSKEFYIQSVFPNPTANYLTVNYYLTHAEKVQATILDSSGNQTNSITLSKGVAGNNTSQINLKNLSSGSYTLELKTKTNSCNIRFVKQ